MTSTLDADTDIDNVELVLSKDQDRLEDLLKSENVCDKKAISELPCIGGSRAQQAQWGSH